MNLKQTTIACAIALGAASTALAQTPPATPVPSARGPGLDLALEAAQAAIDSCKARDQKAAVSVVDSAGVVRVLLASDGASPRGVSSSTSKAVTALTFKAPTSQLAETIKTDKELADKIAANTNYNARAGGVLLAVNGEIIGAVGVGGARGSNVDEECGLVGVQKIQSRLR
ncbi:heme-binding protein [Ferribacterium limneticum]|jgi:uncharacterized protein GlcG (DUF336 family)|uniref:heme-binding protein n=1 Tax=Ferribacterium limneticum TaxID=76259 RepID=UPI001CFBFC58|nr:heme-binding protein [Ferribacterium limneticum]UCV20087.1 heme-binding protein [Ferribacterium limneticum]